MVAKELADRPGRIYAVGDVHGHANRLKHMHEAIRRDLDGAPEPDALLVHLGDYIDRGPDSAGCLSLLTAGPPIPGVPTVNLLGNHERMLLDALEGTTHDAMLWLSNGGGAALESWGIAPWTPPGRWAERIPETHLGLLRGLSRTHEAGGYLFVHAGVRPGVPLAHQQEHDLIWIREGFLDWDGTMLPEAPDQIIVHGHTPSKRPEIRRNRIGIDTNAARGGPLTCAVLGSGPPRFLQA